MKAFAALDLAELSIFNLTHVRSQFTYVYCFNKMVRLKLIRIDSLRAQMHVRFDIAPRLLLVTPDIADITYMTLLAKPQKPPVLKNSVRQRAENHQ